jgi:membrane protein YdbS with pleckstrin-like domain
MLRNSPPHPPGREPPSADLRPVWFAIGLLLALFVAVAAGVLSWIAGKDVAASFLTGGGAFAATAFLAMAMIDHLTHPWARWPR